MSIENDKKIIERSKKAYARVSHKIKKGHWILTEDGPGIVQDIYFPFPVPLDHEERKYREFWYIDLSGRFHGAIMHDIGSWCKEITVYVQIQPSSYKLYLLSKIQLWDGEQEFAPPKPSKSQWQEYTLRGTYVPPAKKSKGKTP